jgi:hypothetical protein
MFPIVVLQLSQDYDIGLGTYNYFNMTPSEEAHILKHFPPFNAIWDATHQHGYAVKELNMSSLEIALLSAIFLMSDG